MPRLPTKGPKFSPSKNPFLLPGVNRLSRTGAFKKRHGWLKKKASTWKTAPKPTKAVATKEKKFGNSTRIIKKKAPRFYSEEDIPHRLFSRKNKHHPTRLRSSITPGTVLILLAGRFRGSRVVFLKQLHSGLLLVNGPFKINGVPIRRVNQVYVIATSTKIDISDVKFDKKFNDKYFKPQKKKKPHADKKAEKKDGDKKEEKKEEKKDKKEEKKEEKKGKSKGKKDLFAEKVDKKKKKVDSSRIEDQKALDALLIPKIKKVPLLKKFLRSKFSLKKGQHPHLLKF